MAENEMPGLMFQRQKYGPSKPLKVNNLISCTGSEAEVRAFQTIEGKYWEVDTMKKS